MKDEQHIQDIFQKIRELPPEVDLGAIEKLVLLQPAAIFVAGSLKGSAVSSWLTIKKLIIMISSVSLIGTAMLFVGLNDSGKPPVKKATPPPVEQRTVVPATDTTIPQTDALPLTDSTLPDLPKSGPATLYLFSPNITDTAPPMNEVMIGPGMMVVKIPSMSYSMPYSMPYLKVYPSDYPKEENAKKENGGGCDDETHVVSTFVKEMEKDGLLNPERYTFTFTRDALTVNRKKVDAKTYGKYLDIFEKTTGQKMLRGMRFTATYANCNCSITMQVKDWDLSTTTATGISAPDPVSTPEPALEPVVAVGSVSLGVSGKGITHTVAEFSKIEIQGSANVKIVAGNEFSVQTQRDDPSGVGTVVKDGRLVISQSSSNGDVVVTMPADRLRSVSVSGSGDVRLASPFAGITSLHVGGSGSITIEKGVETTTLDIQVMGSGEVAVWDIKAQKVTALLLGSGDIAASGIAESISVTVTGSGDVNMGKLTGNDVECEVQGSGSLRIGARTTLKAKISGSGDVIYTGNPTVEKKVSGSGTVTQQ